MREHSHTFDYPIFMLYLDLQEVEPLFDALPFFSYEKWNVASFFRRDYIHPTDKPIADTVRDFIFAQTGEQHSGPIRMLAHIRYFGICFNPITLYYCFDQNDQHLQYLVAEVHNTPWNQRHCYLLHPQPGKCKHDFSFAKALHVSPFLPVDMSYRCVFTDPGDTLLLHLENIENATVAFDATLRLERFPLDRTHALKTLRQFPWMTFSVVKGIYWQAFKLWRKNVTFFSHPGTMN